MKTWTSRKVSDQEWQVIETRFACEPEFILARCSGPVPADDIITAMFLAQSIETQRGRFHNALSGMQNSFAIFDLELKQKAKNAK